MPKISTYFFKKKCNGRYCYGMGSFGSRRGGANPVAVNCIEKLSILLTMFLSWLIMKEKFTARSLVGLGLLTAGIGLIIGFSL